MTQEIIEMARQAGFDEHHAKFDTRIEAFAKLAAEKEREACVKVCEEYDGEYDIHPKQTAEGIALQIRARGQA
jgi:hypothetical protein